VTIDPHGCLIVHRTEVQEQALFLPLFGRLKGTPVPYGGHELGLAQAGEL
jgi:hypothetical protein